MAIEVQSEISITGISPRISFSNDLKNKDNDSDSMEDQSKLCLLDSTSSDFVFCITNGLTQKISSADELFSNGKIVPMEIKPHSNAPDSPYQSQEPYIPSSQPSTTKLTEKKRLKEFLSSSSNETENETEKPSLKYFWQFKRSSSLNFDTTRANSLIRSLHFLSRSNSIGSAPKTKKQEVTGENQKQMFQKQSSISSRRSSISSSSSSSSTYYFYSSPSLNKNYGSSSSGNGVRISPVLNLPHAYIPKATTNFFGIGSLLCNGIIKKKKK
ncbi:hypothetical protein TanjilG_15847 [Lupinus angustifolius]|uniref:Uncharacterized protein n=1 Tax=Lupinus angustifolius TaxID=3871 RepID=A0A1J7HJ90_LUPAN|nr:PREDICTED: A-agglutinin anchorage subunit-like [Lupinus angustifolius]OIW12927.1 hypothetical protein TanjilG_15847 [Lupinus angustifolius]